jgi:hypothetical protein
MGKSEDILAKLDEIMERLETLEQQIQAEHVVIDQGTVHIKTGDRAPICIAAADEVLVDGPKRVSLNVGGDMKGDVSAKKGQLKMKMKVKGGLDFKSKPEDLENA